MDNNIRRFNEGDKESRKLNESIIKKNPHLGLIDERILYDKDFLLEVQAHGYNPLDKEDVENFLQNLPAKNQERNIIISGANEYKYLGQGEYEEQDLAKFAKKSKADVTIKKPEHTYLSDLRGSSKDMLLEGLEELNTNVDDVKLNEKKKRTEPESEDMLRRNMAKVFGSKDIKVNTDEGTFNTSVGMVKSNSAIGETLELIKELRALGFTDEEIKQEIKLRYR